MKKWHIYTFSAHNNPTSPLIRRSNRTKKTRKQMKCSRTFKWVVALLLVAALGISLALTWEPFLEAALDIAISHTPLDYSQPFHPAVEHADRIVVRTGGFNCCRPLDETQVLFEVTDLREVADVRARIAFEAVTTTNSFNETCMCCGEPGMDWYRGKKRLALTAFQHGKGIRWNGFSTGRFLGVRFGYGDAPLTDESQAWVRAWLASHGMQDMEAERKRRRSAANPAPPDGPPEP